MDAYLSWNFDNYSNTLGATKFQIFHHILPKNGIFHALFPNQYNKYDLLKSVDSRNIFEIIISFRN